MSMAWNTCGTVRQDSAQAAPVRCRMVLIGTSVSVAAAVRRAADGACDDAGAERKAACTSLARTRVSPRDFDLTRDDGRIETVLGHQAARQRRRSNAVAPRAGPHSGPAGVRTSLKGSSVGLRWLQAEPARPAAGLAWYRRPPRTADHGDNGADFDHARRP